MFRILWQVRLGEIGNKDVKNAKKVNKKQTVNNGIYEEFWISNVYIFYKNVPWFSKNLW